MCGRTRLKILKASMAEQLSYLLKQLERLNSIGIALSAERDNNRLLEMILLGAKEITNADGGTIYTVTEDKHLKFEIMSNETLSISLGGTTGKEIPFTPLPLYLEDGSKNLTTVAAYQNDDAHRYRTLGQSENLALV